MASHRIVASSAEFMAGDLELPWSSKGKCSFRNRAGNSLESVIRTQETQHVYGIGAGNSKMDRNTRRNDDALRHENKLLRNHAHGE